MDVLLQVALVSLIGTVSAAIISGWFHLRALRSENTSQHDDNKKIAVATRDEVNLIRQSAIESRAENREAHNLLADQIGSVKGRVDHHVEKEEKEMWPRIVAWLGSEHT